MRKVRALVVEESVVSRLILSALLESDPAIEVAGTASTGPLALGKILETMPDVVTFDLETPEREGLRALRAIRRGHPEIPVIVTGERTPRAAAMAMEALALGAVDCVAKPAPLDGVTERHTAFRQQLVAKVVGVGSVLGPNRQLELSSLSSASAGLSAQRSGRLPGVVDVVAIGSSTGGPQALAALLSALPAGLRVPVVAVQHLPPVFTEALAARLDALTGHAVREASAGEVVGPGTVWIAPGNYHMATRRVGRSVRIALHQAPPISASRPSVDVLFDSVAEAYGDRVLAVVLTGMGSDGLRGAERVRRAGGQVIVQDEASSVLWGMAGQIAEAGLADAVLGLDKIPGEIAERLGVRRPGLPSGTGSPLLPRRAAAFLGS